MRNTNQPTSCATTANITGNKRPKRMTYQRTLDMEHNDVLNRIQHRKQEINQMQKQMKETRERLTAYQQIGMPNLGSDQIDDMLHLKDMESHLEDCIKYATEQADETNYLMATGDILFKYYNVVQKGTTLPSPSAANSKKGFSVAAAKKNRYISDDNLQYSVSSGASGAGKTGSGNSAPNDILKYFRKHDSENETSAPNTGNAVAEKTHQPSSSSSYSTSTSTSTSTPVRNHDQGQQDILDDLFYAEDEDDPEEDRASLLDKYMSHVDSNYLKNNVRKNNNVGGLESINKCPHCGCSKRVTMLHDGCIYCTECFTQEYILIDHEKPSYKDPPKEIIYYAYKRINHFNEWLNQIQGKETTEIPEDVYDMILLEIKKEKISNMAVLRKEKVKNILKKLGINKYYEHVPHIIYRLNGLPVPHMPPSLEERLRHMFCQIQVPFLKYAPPERKNFLSYAYVLHKFMQLLEKDEYLPSFPLLKSREKLHNQDLIWQKICAELGWEFYKSI